VTFGDVFAAALAAAQILFSWPNLIYPLVGMFLSMTFSLFPGLTGATLMALAIPLTVQWEPVPVMLLFGAFLGGSTFVGSITAILFNIPGRPSNAAAALDGYPMAQNGEARTAIGCSAAASALGSTVGLLVLIMLLPWVYEVIVLFGPAELLMLIIWGLTTIVILAGESIFKGLSIAGIGLMLSFIGLDPRTAEHRYTFGIEALENGLGLVPIFLGVYALAELFDLMRAKRRTISGVTSSAQLTGSVRRGIYSVFRHFPLFLSSSAIGTLVGMVPGVGGTVASFVAYGRAAQSSKDPASFGHGDIRGLLAPEAANDAKDGGALIPALGFGLPGGTGTAMFLAMLAVHGIEPGREMLNSNLVLVFVLIWSLFLTNWLTSILGIGLIKPLARLTTIRTDLLIAPLILVATMGAYFYRHQVFDVVIAYCFALIGFAMKRLDWPRIPLVIALVLGPLFERNFHLVMRLEEVNRLDFFSRPIVLVLLGLMVAGFLLPYLRRQST
jgi:putative tricarboxylic transport membrane protein